MAEAKTKLTQASVSKFVEKLPPGVKEDTQKIIEMMTEITGDPPKLWGTSIIGFGSYSYTYASGKSGDWPIIGMSPRKQNLTVYIMPGFENFEPQLSKLGKFKTSKSCLYFKRLSDLHLPSLQTIMKKSVAMMKKKHRAS